MSRMDRRRFLCTCARGCLALGAAPLAGSFLDAACAKVGNISNVPGRYFKPLENKEIKCLLCPRHCVIREGERGLCGVRENNGGVYVSKVYGKPAAIKVDAMEKGPFFHFLPATKSLAIGTAGCNLTCLYCQSWQFAQARPEQTDNENLPPADLVAQLKKYGLPSVTFTYSEPTVAIEYLLDTARAARAAGLRTCMHTVASINPEPLKEICSAVDAINVDFKGYSRSFYDDVVGCKIDDILRNLQAIADSNVWLELTNLVVPGYNDDPTTFKGMCQWIAYYLGEDVPLHISRFFPQYRLRNVQATPLEKLKDLRKLAFEAGLQYVYLGNLAGDPAESTYCPKCRAKVIQRVGYEVSFAEFSPKTGKCTRCGLRIPGHWS